MYSASARTYDPGTRRFLSEDPLPSINGHPYAGSSPLLLSDRTGLEALVEYSSVNSENEAKNAEAVCAQGSWTASFMFELATNIALEVALAPLAGHVEGLYSFMDNTGRPYVGRSIDLARRLAEHIRAGRVSGEFAISVRQLANVSEEALAGRSSWRSRPATGERTSSRSRRLRHSTGQHVASRLS